MRFILGLKRIWEKGCQLLQKYLNLRKKNICFSIGENCLPDDLLARNGLKSFSSPYSSARSNIEYILAFEREDFVHFLAPDCLDYELFYDKPVVRNSLYRSTINQYHPFYTHGFEFSHHDVIGDKRSYAAMKRRVRRLLRLKNKNLTLLYHHRLCEKTDMDLLFSHLSQLSEIYQQRGNTVRIFLFYQELVSDPRNRRVEHFQHEDIMVYKFYTLNEWAGADERNVWARNDNDLFEKMIHDIRM